jgi:hypothetical protein
MGEAVTSGSWVFQVVRVVGVVKVERETVSVTAVRAAMAAEGVVREVRMVKAARESTAAPVVREARTDQSQALSLVGAPVHISFFWAF